MHIRPHCLNCVQALADIFSDHEKFILAELQPFFETSSSLENAPSWGIIDAAFLRHLMATIKRCCPGFLGPCCVCRFLRHAYMPAD